MSHKDMTSFAANLPLASHCHHLSSIAGIIARCCKAVEQSHFGTAQP